MIEIGSKTRNSLHAVIPSIGIGWIVAFGTANALYGGLAAAVSTMLIATALDRRRGSR